MLTELSIRNLAVIESVRLDFHHGFHVLTGETGAGKSIIIDALSLIVGARGSAELVRYGKDKAEVEAMFDVPAWHPVWDTLVRLGIEAAKEEHLIIRRDITAGGKSSCRINGQLVNLTMLKEVGEWLVNIHGQHEHQSLIKAEQHIHWLDIFGGKPIQEAKSAYETAYDAYVRIRKQLKELKDSEKQTLQMQDLYKFQIEEISQAKLKIGEDESLAEEKRKLANAEKMYQNSSDSYDALYGTGRGLDCVRKAMQRLQDIASYDTAVLNPLLEQVQSAFYQLEDAAYQLRDYRDSIEFNSERIDEIEQRLDLIASFRRKYGDSVPDILAYLAKIESEWNALEHKEETIHGLERELQQTEKQLSQLALSLSTLRKAAAERLAAEIERELRDLQMERTKFGVRMERIPDGNGIEIEGSYVRITRQGCDSIEFMISANPGEPLRSLAKIASGGEMSRIMLAMKSIFAKVDRIPVLIFDEVDTGVSGRAAQAIAEKLALLSSECQVFSITHLPQVACMADAHYLIRKEVEGERTYTKVQDLSAEQRAQELARMLGGVEITETTLHHAEEMLRLADDQKAAHRNNKEPHKA